VIISVEDAQSYVKRYFATYTNVRKYHNAVESKVKERLIENGEFGWVKTLGGRLRRLEKAFLENPELYYTAITMAINCTIQGGVSDMIKVAMVEIQRIFKEKGWLDPENNIWDAYIQGQVHDELMVECKKELAEEVKVIVVREMEAAGVFYKIKVPMTADAKIVEHLEKD
jgi:DNA polymerase I-like protein with 3'-5' exonuclease and polymerase domains